MVSDLLRTLLKNRGVEAENHIAAFLNPNYDEHLHSPSLLGGMQSATDRLLRAIEANERIAVYADFDSDGIPGGALLFHFFVRIGFSNFEVYIPHRDLEGYGFHREAIDALAEKGTSLIITVDVGITASEEVLYAKEKGIDTIVTDHHEISGPVPMGVSVVNPKLGGYPFRDLCGAAVAFKLVQATLEKGRARGMSEISAVPLGWEKWLLDLVAIATIADMVPLVGENRVLARFGLEVLRKSRRPGVIALCSRLRLRKSELTEDDVAFSIAPRINAASRMDDPDLAFRLLTTRDELEAERLVLELERLNARRRTMVAAIVREAKRRVRERPASGKVIVLGSTEWKPALLGLAANSIVEERGGVVCLWGRDARGRLKGSCRSDGSLSIVELFQRADGAVIQFGGHKASGGFSLSVEQVDTLQDRLEAAAGPIERSEEAQHPQEDIRVSISEVTHALYRELSLLAPFGVGNPKPVFLVTGGVVSSVRTFGRDRTHVELLLSCKDTGARARAFDFFRTPESFTAKPSPGSLACLRATIEKDSWAGANALALRLVDVLPEP